MSIINTKQRRATKKGRKIVQSEISRMQRFESVSSHKLQTSFSNLNRGWKFIYSKIFNIRSYQTAVKIGIL